MTLFRFLGIGVVLSWYAMPLHATDAIDARALKKADLIGVQATLAQRVVKAACFISSYSDMDQNRDKMVKSAQAFERNLGSLNSDALSGPWREMDFAVNLLAQSDPYGGMEMNMLSVTSEILATALSSEFEEITSRIKQDVDIIRLSGRLTSLTQKAAKEYCLISLGLNANANRNALGMSVQEFDQILEDLIAGSEAFNIIAPPTPEIATQLGLVQTRWMALRGVLAEAANSKPVQGAEFQMVEQSNEIVMREARKLTKLYLAYFQKDSDTSEPIE